MVCIEHYGILIIYFFRYDSARLIFISIQIEQKSKGNCRRQNCTVCIIHKSQNFYIQIYIYTLRTKLYKLFGQIFCHT